MKKYLGTIIKSIILIAIITINIIVIGNYISLKESQYMCVEFYGDKTFALISQLFLIPIIIFAIYFIISEMRSKDKTRKIITIIVLIVCSIATLTTVSLELRTYNTILRCGHCVNMPKKNCECYDDEELCECKYINEKGKTENIMC